MRTCVAKAAPFQGKPYISLPEVFGGSPNKPFSMRIPVLGQRPVKIYADNLPDGLSLNGNRITGRVSGEGEYSLLLRAENALGSDEKTVLLKIAPDGMLRTPLLGFTTWNAYAQYVTQADVEKTAKMLFERGYAEYGYAYVNVDSAWQGEYDLETNAIRPNRKFPDMKKMYDTIHSFGFKGGIYSTPFLEAWGCPDDMERIPGCTRGERDIRFPDINTGIGQIHCEKENVRQWTEWGIDYLKYDWAPTEPVNADLMKKALLASPREIALCVTTSANVLYSDYWNKNCASWRDNGDTQDIWQNIRDRFEKLAPWAGKTSPGHCYDLDMLAIGPMKMNDGKCRLTPEEELTAVSFHAFWPSPVQLSMVLGEESELEFDLVCNEEVLRINQDVLCDYPALVSEEEKFRIYSRKLANGDIAYAVFNFSEDVLTGELALNGRFAVRNVWEKRDLGVMEKIPYVLDGHEAAIFRVSEDK